MTAELAEVNRPETVEAQIAAYLVEHPEAADQRASRRRKAHPDRQTATSPEALTHQLVITGSRVLIDGVFGAHEIGVSGGLHPDHRAAGHRSGGRER